MRILIGVVAAMLGGRFAFAAGSAGYLNLGLNQTRYFGAKQSATQSSNYTYLGADINIEPASPGFKYKLNVVAQDAIGVRDELYYGVPEAFVQPKLGQGFNLVIGRQKRSWSRLDEEFNLGVWQPQLRWDYLAPKQQGLLGVFFDIAFSEELSLTVYTLPIFLPDQGPNYQLTNGQFVSRNRWFSQPQSRVQLFNNAGVAPGTPIYFELDRPPEEQVINNTGYGLGFNYRKDSFWSALNYAFKPQNQIHLGVECATCVNIGGPGPGEVTLTIHPSVIKHHVFTLESGYDGIDSRGYLSVTGDFPNASKFPAGYWESPLNSMIIVGGAYQRNIRLIEHLPSQLKFSYIRVFTTESRERKAVVEAEQVRSSLDRYPYREVAAAEMRNELVHKESGSLNLKARYSYSIPEKGGWVSAELAWNYHAVTLSAGADILGTGVADDSANAGLFTKYRSNDRVFGGVAYVF